MVSCFTVQSASCIFNVVVGTMADIAVVISSTTPISMGLSASCDIELLILAGQLYPAAMVTQFFCPAAQACAETECLLFVLKGLFLKESALWASQAIFLR
jgi:hypothetical protein